MCIGSECLSSCRTIVSFLVVPRDSVIFGTPGFRAPRPRSFPACDKARPVRSAFARRGLNPSHGKQFRPRLFGGCRVACQRRGLAQRVQGFWHFRLQTIGTLQFYPQFGPPSTGLGSRLIWQSDIADRQPASHTVRLEVRVLSYPLVPTRLSAWSAFLFRATIALERRPD